MATAVHGMGRGQSAVFNNYLKESWLHVHYCTVRMVVEFVVALGFAAFLGYLILQIPR